MIIFKNPKFGGEVNPHQDQKRGTRSLIDVTANLVENQLKSGANITKKVITQLKEKFDEFTKISTYLFKGYPQISFLWFFF